MKKIIVVLFAFLFGASTLTSAQKSGMSIQLGGILPALEFNDAPGGVLGTGIVVPGTNSFGSGGGAMFGASFGLKYTYMFKNKAGEDLGLGLFFAADGMWNTLNEDLRELYNSISCTYSHYANVPIMIGVSYTTQFSSVFGIWAEVGAGADLFFKTYEGWKDNTTKYLMNASFAAEAGAGFIFGRVFSIGAHYYFLGKQNVKTSIHELDYTMKTGVWAFKLGFHF